MKILIDGRLKFQTDEEIEKALADYEKLFLAL
jgi:hypothetical protein